jgi:hypothetical protein
MVHDVKDYPTVLVYLPLLIIQSMKIFQIKEPSRKDVPGQDPCQIELENLLKPINTNKPEYK